MFQKSLLKNFAKSFNAPNYDEIIKLVKKDKYIAEDANGAEFIVLLSKMLNWTHCIREVKNSTDMKKADGVVYNEKNDPIAIIELKSSDKKISNRDIIAQAFRYKNEKPTCKYVIVSNFKQLDIYSDSSDVCFSLDMTHYESYIVLYALLNQTSLETNEIARLKKLSKSQDQITKEVYKEYSDFRLKLLNNLIENNKELTRENVFECANKLLDRFMFILFAEDRGLIPANSIDTIIKQYESSHEWGDETPLYNYYKKYFHFIDVGNEKVKIPKYNGNLFKPDEQLENLIIDDHIIKADLSHLSAYDFSDDVDVEVLGHIFEQSLNDLEKIKESLLQEHQIVNTRKKDGVFYTPKFITEYIVNNTLAKLCRDKKEELKLHEAIKDTKKAKEKRRDTLHEYREYLESLKIVDPACGSGAFLTACFRYLFSEHKWLQKELFKYEAGLFDYHDIDKQIIEQNLFGVDINGASVGIAKLSLWLQTAKRDRPLSNLMGNIKSANSLTTDWSELFPEIMANGGFDCVIGNPPYVRHESIKELKPALKEIYSVFTGTADLFVYFYELAQNILKTDGMNGFICSNKFFRAKYGQNLREMILTKTTIKSIVDFNSVKVFEDATVDSTITILQKGYIEDSSFQISLNNYDNFFNMTQKDLTKDSFSFVTPDELAIKKKIEKVGTPLKEWDIKINYGIKTGFNEAFIIDGTKKDELIKADNKNKEIIKPLLRGKDIKKYSYNFADKWLINIHNNPPINIEEYPIIKEHLDKYYDKLAKRSDKGKTPYNLRNCAYLDKFEKTKIIYPDIANKLTFTFDDKGYYFNNTVYFLDTDSKYIFAILNSKIINYYYGFVSAQLGSKALRAFSVYIKQLPIPKLQNTELYKKNIEYLLDMPQKEIYDKTTKYLVAEVESNQIYLSEFLFAKNRGFIANLQSHSEIDQNYFKLLPYILKESETYQNKDNKRIIYAIKLDEKGRRMLHIVDEYGFIVSIFVVREKSFEKQIRNGRIEINQQGGTAIPLTVGELLPHSLQLGSCHKALWRQTDLLELLYQELTKKSISQNDFIKLVDTILQSKEKIAKYNKHFESLNAIDKIEIKEEIEKLDILVQESVDEIDKLVYGLYGLSDGEIGIVEGE